MAYTVVPANGTANQIVNLDSNPPVRNTAGWKGAAQRQLVLVGYAVAPINMPTTNFLPLVRIPTNAIVHKVSIACDAAPSTSLTGSLGVTFSDAPTASGGPPGGDGTPPSYASTYALTGASPSIVSQSFFQYATNIATYVGKFTDVTFANYANSGSVTDGFYVPSAANQPLWSAMFNGGLAGLGAASSGSSPSAFVSCNGDPFGFFDICWFETTTGVNTAAVTLSCEVVITVDGT